MAEHANSTPASRFHNLLKRGARRRPRPRGTQFPTAAEAEIKALKDEFKRRGLTEVAGDAFTVTCTEQIAGRLDAKAVKEHLGAAYHRFENAVISIVIRIKAANRLAIAA